MLVRNIGNEEIRLLNVAVLAPLPPFKEVERRHIEWTRTIGDD